MAEERQQIDVSLLNYFKDLHGGHKIIYVRFSDRDFVFRTLTRREYKYILASYSGRLNVEDAICNTTCLYPEDYEFEKCGFAGFASHVASIIEESSGVTDITTVLDEYRQIKEINTLEMQCMDLIKAFIPEYTYEEMESWTWQKLMQMTVRAEKVAQLKGFDWHIEDKTDEYMESMSKISMDNPEFIKELQDNGIDPMMYFFEDLKEMPLGKKEIIDFPLIGGMYWNSEEILDVIRKQIAKKKAVRRP